MPTISVFFGVVVRMYWLDHPQPHIHAFYQGQQALFAISSGEMIGGRLPRRLESLIADRVLARQGLLLDN